MKFEVFARMDEQSGKMKETLISILKENYSWIHDSNDPEFVICIGGDGTILRAVHHYLDRLESVLFVGIHTGTLGFFTDYSRDEFEELVRDLTNLNYSTESYPLLKLESSCLQDPVFALNEVRIGDFSSTCRYEIRIDGEFFEKTVGCGLCVATQIGSTGANRSLQGAVVDPGLQVMQLTEIMPVSHSGHHSLKNPYIMKADRTIEIKENSECRTLISFDHRCIPVNTPGAVFRISMSDKRVKFARFRPYSYLKRLKTLY